MVSRRRRRVIQVMVWWCRLFAGFTALVVVAEIADREVFGASWGTALVIGHLYYLDLFNQELKEGDS